VGGGGVSVNETVEVKPISGKIDINVTATGASPKIIEDMLSKASVTLKERIFEIVAEQSKITPDRIK
jgi:YbbR domain-containing protein